jgi:hypothetical protein
MGFDQAFLGAFEHEIQAVEVVQAATATERVAEPTLDEFAHHLPVPVSQLDASRRRRRLDGGFQLGLLLAAEGGGEPPVCSNLSPAGPACWKFANHSLMVCGSRSSATATCAADQPSASSHSACQRSRSHGLGSLPRDSCVFHLGVGFSIAVPFVSWAHRLEIGRQGCRRLRRES